MNSKDNVLLEKPVFSLFMKYALPALLAMILTGIQGIVDGIFVGNFIGPEAMASINIASPFMQVSIGSAIVISIGSQSHIGIKLGMDKVIEAKNTLQTFLRILFIVALLISVFGFLFNDSIASLLGANHELIESTGVYIRVISLFTIPVCFMIYSGFLNRIVGKPQLYLYGSITTLVVNIILNYLFLAVLDMGIFGAALATGIAYSSALLINIPNMLNKKNIINFRDGSFSKNCIVPVLYNGASEGINSISTALSAFLFNISMMNIAGVAGVSAFSTINYIAVFGAMVLFGISDGVGPIVSYNFGHGSASRVKKIMRIAYTVNLLSGIVVFIALFFFGTNLVTLFVQEPELVALATNGGKLYAFAFLLSGFNILNSGYFTFIGKGVESMIIASCRGIICIAFAIYVLPLILGINGIWLTVPFAECIATVVSLYLLKKNRINN